MELDTDTRISTLLSKLLLEVCSLEYFDIAEQTYNSMFMQYPNDERTQIAEQILRLITGTETYGGTGKKALKVEMRTFPKKNISAQSLLPKEFSLKQNFPNPFNPVTLIKYELPHDEFVTLKIYDLLGREVFVLVNGFEQAGYKIVRFDASRIASGVYFYKMKAGNFQAMKKLLLVK